MQKVRQYASLGCAVAGIQFNTHGCRANSQADAAPTAAPIAEPTNTLPPNQRPLAVPSNSANSGLTQLQLLNRALVGWEMKNHRHPLTFEEFASTANIQIPDPPAGQKYAFSQKGFIVLVNATQ